MDNKVLIEEFREFLYSDKLVIPSGISEIMHNLVKAEMPNKDEFVAHLNSELAQYKKGNNLVTQK